jgi:type IV pilus assembly protein PilY1
MRTLRLALFAAFIGVCLAACLCAGARAATTPAPPPLVVPDLPLGVPGGRVPPNLLLNLSLTFADAGAAYRERYDRALDYAGYFNPRMCYSYPLKKRSGQAPEPDLDERTGYFAILKPSDARHECGGDAFSGNFLNWAASATLDLLRYGLTGGDRVIDEPGLTVLQRAWLPDGRFHPDFTASEAWFPRKLIDGANSSASRPGQVTPFNTDVLYVVSCRNRILFSGTDNSRACGDRKAASDKFLGEFNARVKVCSEADSASRPDLCRQYAGGFKPEGSIQRHSAAARIGLMAYLTEHGADDTNLYGGVLRAPLKFVGPSESEAPLFASADNPRSEWNPGSGVLAANPDRAGAARSGMINYINQLGRADAGRVGQYKGADPGAEMYYESLRYLQGRDPTTAAAATDAGFPVWSRRADPVIAACQRNAVATIGHAGFSDDRFLPGNARSGKADQPRAVDPFAPGAPFDAPQSAARVGAMEADSTGIFRNSAPRPDLLDLANLDIGPGGAGSYYLAGAAYWAHTRAIRSDLPVRVDSYSLELGAASKPGASALYLAAKYGAFDDRNGDANPFITSARRTGESEWSRDGSKPDAYFAAPDGAAVVAAVRALFDEAAARPGLQPGRLVAGLGTGGAGLLVESGFTETTWSGRLERRALLAAAGGTIEIGNKPLWEAGTLLTGDPSHNAPPRLAPQDRKIYTLVRAADQPAKTVPFKWTSLGREERALLDLAPSSAQRDGLGEARVAFLRGERTREAGQPNGTFRRRASVLGDTIHSLPLLVGPPSASVQGPGYATFHARYKSRANAIYLGANDGMLHAFDAADGAELFAYVPNALMPVLNQLADPSYRHRPYVDASAGQGEALLGGQWRSVLVSGMGLGARGVFALDVSDPAAFDAGMRALWEFSGQDDPAIGHVSEPPLVAKLKVGTKGGVPEYRYFAVLSSGVNNYGQDAMQADSGGALFLLALDKPATARWQEGVNYFKLAAPAAEPGQANALAAPVLVMAGDGSARYAYAGDLQGRLWRFDFSGKPPYSSKVLFEARDSSGHAQPISQAPRVVFAPGGGYVVLFGTGKLIEDADLQAPNFGLQSFYAVRDSAASPLAAVGGRGELARRTLSGEAKYTIKGAAFDYTGTDAKKGWYFDFPRARTDGERLAAAPVLASGAVLVHSLLPGADACGALATRSYVLDALTGFAFAPDGVPASGSESGELKKNAASAALVVMDLDAFSAPRDATGSAVVTRRIGVLHLHAGEDPAPSVERVDVRLPARRISWRELVNWQELHEAAKK